MVFLYMSFQIGALRFDTFQYNPYIIYFHDSAGLSPKADVQIAGVKVGWVDNIELVHNGNQVKTNVMVHRDYVLHSDACGVIRQDGLLGSKYVDLDPGSSRLPIVKPEGVLSKPSRDLVVMDDVLYSIRDIVSTIEEAAGSVKSTFGGNDGGQYLANLFQRVDHAVTEFGAVAERLDALIEKNNQAINETISHVSSLARDLESNLPSLVQNVQAMTAQVSEVAEPVSKVMQRINDGNGVLGQLIADDEISHDFRYAVNGARSYFEKVEQLAIVIDGHGESMQGLGNFMKEENAKGYVNIRIHPAEDYFYLAGLVGAQSGIIEREEKFRTWFDADGNKLVPGELDLADFQRLRFAPKKRTVERKLDQLLYNAQVGKVYGDVAFRAGVFENTFGVAVDFDIPFQSDYMRWVTSLELYDFSGRNRISDDRAHLKWINKVFLTHNAYVTFGADDFISETNKNAFIGAGLRFADDDLKYVVSQIHL